MSTPETATPSFEEVVALLLEVRDDLDPADITAASMPVEDLGLDSLDLIQLARLLRKRHGVDMFLETWPWRTQPLGTLTEHLLPLS